MSSLTTAHTAQMLEQLPALNTESLEDQHTLHAASRQGKPYAHLCQNKALSLPAHFLGMNSSPCSTPHFLIKSHLSSSLAAWICHPTGMCTERVGKTSLPPSAQFLALVIYTGISTHLKNIWELTDFNCLIFFSPYCRNQWPPDGPTYSSPLDFHHHDLFSPPNSRLSSTTWSVKTSLNPHLPLKTFSVPPGF